jgi:hypothetical protein
MKSCAKVKALTPGDFTKEREPPRPSISGGQAKHIPDFFPDSPPARDRHMSAFGDKERDID